MAKNEIVDVKPQTRRTVDGYASEHLNGSRSYDYIHSSNAGSGTHHDLQRHSSMPTTSTSAPVSAPPMQQQQSNSSGQMSDITEEPDDIARGMSRVGLGYDDLIHLRSGGRRTKPLERSNTMPSVQETDIYSANRAYLSPRTEGIRTGTLHIAQRRFTNSCAPRNESAAPLPVCFIILTARPSLTLWNTSSS